MPINAGEALEQMVALEKAQVRKNNYDNSLSCNLTENNIWDTVETCYMNNDVANKQQREYALK